MMRFAKVVLLLLIVPLLLSLSIYTVDAQNRIDDTRSERDARREARRLERLRRLTKTPTPTKALILTNTPTKTPTRTPSPTKKPTSTPTPTRRSSTPTPTLSQSTSTDSVKTYIMNEINEYRKSRGLSEVKTDSYTCNFAKTRAAEIVNGFNHDGFRDRIDNKTLPYPSYSSVTENLAMTSNYQEVVDMWINSSGHAENMRRDTPYVCVERNGNYYAYEGWKP